ncbi:MAG TPA: FecR family protein [Gammaproteobacteria bacterium]
MSNERDPEVERERALEQLFARAEPRLQPPPADAEEVRRAVKAEWDALAVRRRRTLFASVAAAAAALASVAVYFGGGGPAPGVAPPLVASVERVQGTVTTATGARLVAGSGILAGARLESGDGQVSLRLASGGSLRIAPSSRVVLSSGDEAELVAGVLYFDSEEQRAAEFVVTTELGRVRDVGTQFLVRLDGDQLDVGVRDGRVTLERGGAADEADAGERLIASQGSNVRRDSIDKFGGEWEWAERLAPPFDTNGRTLGEFLVWFEGQTGRSVVFADAATERELRDAALAGNVLEGPPLQRLSTVLDLNALTYSLEGDRVVIRRAR